MTLSERHTDLHVDFAWNRYLPNSLTSSFSVVIENKLRKRLLKKADRMLLAAKYLRYADMVACRELGRGTAGATYAALPYGPQLNNYRDLADEIKRADESIAESLTSDELRIIERLANTFPDEKMIYDAAHREGVWKEKRPGAVILYSESKELTEA
jgi:hypothetical protein